MTTTTYTRAQLIDALQREYEYLCHDDYNPAEDFSLSEHLDYLNAMSYDELLVETATDDDHPLSEFIYAYS